MLEVPPNTVKQNGLLRLFASPLSVGVVVNLVGLVVDAIFSVLKNERPYTPMLN